VRITAIGVFRRQLFYHGLTDQEANKDTLGISSFAVLVSYCR